MTMTNKQKAFADEYLKDLNGTRAYKAAYPRVKKDSVARANASRLLTKANVKEYIDEQLEILHNERVADARETLERITLTARREVKEHTVVTLRSKIERWVPTGEDGTLKKEVVETEEPRVVEMPAKLSDVNKSLEMLGRYHALFTDKVDLQSGDIVIKVGDWDDDESTAED